MPLFKKRRSAGPVTDGRSQRRLDRKTYIIHHYCPHTFNAGDHFVVRAIRQHLTRYLPRAVFVPKACSDNRGWGKPIGLRGENITFSNRHADAVLVGGSDQYNNWSLRIKKEEIAHLAPPLFLVGLGVSSRSIDAPPRIDKASYLEDIRATNEKAALSSVRDHYTQRFLEDLGFNDSVVTGCPSMYLFDRDFSLDPGGPVALTFPFPVVRTGDKVAYSALVDSIGEIISMVRTLGLKPVIVCHDDRDVTAAQQLFAEEEIYFSNYVDDVIRFYERTSVVVGSRLHASILASGLGKPFINVNLDVRGRGFTETFGLADWNLDANDPGLVAGIGNRLTSVLSGDLTAFDRFSTIRASFKRTYMDFMRDVAEKIVGAYVKKD
jgi:hypothetical protein